MPSKTGLLLLDRSRQVAVQIHEILKERILSVSLEPGSVLSRAALQDEFGVSQTPVRDALLRLQEDGLVDIFPQYATRVSRIDIDHARQAQFLRLSVEVEALRRLSVESPKETAAALEAVLNEQERFADPATYDRFDALDREFHRVLYERSRSLMLWKVMRRQSVHLDRLRRLNLPMPGKMQSLLIEHRAIVTAIARGDGQAAEAAMRTHLSGTLSIIEEIRTRFPDFILNEAANSPPPRAFPGKV
ncbi:GntR family transcriptional regulator [Rhizobium paknamense]|uniref:DNA-binding GntR family transcriptional regulator n=1 Tax=Rhizobium paknamense TaxID=1206817 RepID=A0ABU0I7P1_9HYPH|nr:GntR family transcriptional regulator [Rhizobium paknamense]MDQ0454230.1 DNA-binding GntR family transcriptional regulator [Rhizobium paknamense]